MATADRIETIDTYDAVFAARTGLTILIPKNATFDVGVEIPVYFKVSPSHPRDLVVEAAGRAVVIKDLRKEYLDAAITRGSFMFYETVDDEVVRCTPCTYHTS